MKIVNFNGKKDEPKEDMGAKLLRALQETGMGDVKEGKFICGVWNEADGMLSFVCNGSNADSVYLLERVKLIIMDGDLEDA